MAHTSLLEVQPPPVPPKSPLRRLSKISGVSSTPLRQKDFLNILKLSTNHDEYETSGYSTIDTVIKQWEDSSQRLASEDSDASSNDLGETFTPVRSDSDCATMSSVYSHDYDETKDEKSQPVTSHVFNVSYNSEPVQTSNIAAENPENEHQGKLELEPISTQQVFEMVSQLSSMPNTLPARHQGHYDEDDYFPVCPPAQEICHKSSYRTFSIRSSRTSIYSQMEYPKLPKRTSSRRFSLKTLITH